MRTSIEAAENKTDRGDLVHIYFGSQTGKAEALAHQLHEEAGKQQVRSRVLDLEDFSPDVFTGHRAVILLVANTGDGDPTDNAVAFHRWLTCTATPDGCLKSVAFTVFGLGDRSYPKFNRMGDVTDHNMERLGARRIHVKGVGDDSGDLASDFRAWLRNGFWSALAQLVPSVVSPSLPAVDETRLSNLLLNVAESCAGLPPEIPSEPADVLARFYTQADTAQVVSVQELRAEPSLKDGRSTAHVTLDISNRENLQRYLAAGTLEILPQNEEGEVEDMMPLLRAAGDSSNGSAMISLNSFISFSPSQSSTEAIKTPFPTPCTLSHALTCFCDLKRPPTRRMLRAMIPFLEPSVRRRIDHLLSDDLAMKIIQDEALAWTQWEFWTGIGALQLDLQTFLLHCPRQRSRPFTIASSPLTSPTEIHLCVSLVSRPALSLDDAVKVLKVRNVLPADLNVAMVFGKRTNRINGLCSQWLCARLRVGTQILVRYRPSSFRLASADVPLVMIGAGAGVAPFRAFWNELSAQQIKAPVALFFGCRKPDEDFIYSAEMKTAAAQQRLTELIVAFSQGQEQVQSKYVGNKKYVQDMLSLWSAELRQWIANGAVVYVCGSNGLGAGVIAKLTELLGDNAVLRLRSEGRLIQELWGQLPSPIDWVQALAEEQALISARQPPQPLELIDCNAVDGNLREGSRAMHLVQKRRSIFPKDYTGQLVEDADVEQLLDVARWAPTHGKTEPWRFVVYSGEARHRLIDSTLDFYKKQNAVFWNKAWNGEFKDFSAFQVHVEKQRRGKWLKCSHLIGICMRRQQPEKGKRLFPEHEEVAAVACAVQNMHLLATSLRIAAYWSSWFDHFVASEEGVALHRLCAAEGDKWLGVFCVGHSDRMEDYRATRRPVDEIATWHDSYIASHSTKNAARDAEPPTKRLRASDPLDLTASEVGALIRSRRSIFPKDYTGALVDDGIVQKLLEAARWAPTHGKTEPWRFVVYSGAARHRLIDATLSYYARRDASFWSEAWSGEFKDFGAFYEHVHKQRKDKWMKCSHLVSICMRRQQPQEGKKLFPEHEEVAAVACAVQNMHLVATSMRIGAYWTSWFDHFVASPDGANFHGLSHADGDRWLGLFCIGHCDRMDSYRSARRPVGDISEWRRS